MSRVVTDPLREEYAWIENQRGSAVEELLAIADRAAIYLKGPYADHGELPVDGDLFYRFWAFQVSCRAAPAIPWLPPHEAYPILSVPA